MRKKEFITILQKTLSGRVSYRVVNENVSFYENYIDTEIRKGRNEKEVLEELGDPRLIAKTIIGTSGQEAGRELSGEEAEPEQRGFFGRIHRLPGWLAFILAAFILIVLFQILGALFSLLLPILLPALLAWMAVKMFWKK